MKSSFTRNGTMKALNHALWFLGPGASFVVDGQFGSTGKGLISSILGEYASGMTTLFPPQEVTSNAGPNSGHTGFVPGSADRLMLQQLPVSAVVMKRLGRPVPVILNGGAVIDQGQLLREVWEQDMRGWVFVDPAAAIVEQVDREEEASGSVAAIASTSKGVGSALARKILRRGNVAATFRQWLKPYGIQVTTAPYSPGSDRSVLVEVSQGFSLGINSGFYPATTSRECTVQQAMADARLPVQTVRNVVACYRTFPIRVGNTDKGNSGKGYADQQETSWEALGLEPELTSVTKRVRRVFTWSRTQFCDSLRVNRPDTLFLNFMQYLRGEDLQHQFVGEVVTDYCTVMGRKPRAVLLGFGPLNGDVISYQG